jgi:hypothetical protein
MRVLFYFLDSSDIYCISSWSGIYKFKNDTFFVYLLIMDTLGDSNILPGLYNSLFESSHMFFMASDSLLELFWFTSTLFYKLSPYSWKLALGKVEIDSTS